MDEKTPIVQPQNGNLKSGPEIVADFLKEIDARADLDRPTVNAILTLHAAGKLTANNLLKALDSVRAGGKK
jgi:hypothetical protein